ncbi:hypothetical protein BU15DRAFT_81468 [Melanogaster broomeanus]|nr:hypothetical protein BU15DRAFT_81468 [Melanogaster broomeanus]
MDRPKVHNPDLWPRVVILFQDGAYRASSAGDFVVWDWSTGKQEMFIQCAELRSFSMLTKDLILAATVPTPREPCLDVLSISEFQLPRVRGDDLNICIRSEPNPLATPSPRVPFAASQGDCCLYVVVLRLLDDNFTIWPVVLMALRSTFVARANRNHGSEDAVSQVIPWQDWGPASTRILPLDPSDSWIRYTNGTKYIHPAAEHTANLYDFNQHTLRSYRLPPKSPEAAHDSSMWTLLESESKIRAEVSPFLEDVTTRLPGGIAILELQKLARIHDIPRGPFPLGPSLGPMLTEDHIVLAVSEVTYDALVYLYM